MTNSFEQSGSDELTPDASGTPENIDPKLQALITRRDTLQRWVESGEGTPADASILDKLDKQIKDFK